MVALASPKSSNMGEFVLDGLDEDAPAELCIESEDAIVCKIVELTAAQTANYPVVGDIVVPTFDSLSRDATLDMTVTNSASLDVRVEEKRKMITFISDDAERIYQFGVAADGKLSLGLKGRPEARY